MFNTVLLSQIHQKIRFVSLLLLVLAVFILIPAGKAQELTPNAPTDNEVNAVAKQLYCPVCENTPLDVCPTQACAEWRDLIREKLAQGWSEQQIKEYFVDQFGDRVLATPPARGINWLVYIIPPLAFIIGGVILFRAFKSWKEGNEVSPTQEVLPANDEYIDRLEEELRKL